MIASRLTRYRWGITWKTIEYWGGGGRLLGIHAFVFMEQLVAGVVLKDNLEESFGKYLFELDFYSMAMEVLSV